MKQLVNYLLVLIPMLAMSQAPGTIHFQAQLSAPSDALGNSVTVDVAIKDAPNSQSDLFTERHNVNVGATGLLIFDIGSKSNLTGIDWSTGSHYLEITVDGEVLGVSEIVKVPYASYAAHAGSINALDYNNLANAPDLSQADTDPSDDFDGDYESLSNPPTTITVEESGKLDLLTATSAVDLDQMKTDVAANNVKVEFPGFGTTAGTAFIQKWSKIGDDLYYPEGSAGIGVTSSSAELPSLSVGTTTKVDRVTPSAATPGMLYLDETTGEFKYYNESGEVKDLYNTTTSEFGSGFEQTRDVNVGRSLVVGSIATQPAGDATLVVASTTPIIRFDDTSNSGSFPNNDWEIRANDLLAGGDNYFSFVDITNNLKAFRVEPDVPDNTFYMTSSGAIALGSTNATAELDVTGQEVRATAFVGDAGGLTGLSGAGTSSVENTGSTTIEADNDGDNDGSIVFETASTTRMTLSDEGNVGIGTSASATEALTVSGTSVASDVHIDPSVAVFGWADGKRLVVFTSNPGGFIQPTTSTLGQELIILNKAAEDITIFHGSTLSTLPQYGSVTLVNSSSGWVVKYRSM